MIEFKQYDTDDIRFVADTHFRSRSLPGEADRRDRFIRFLRSLPSGCALFMIGDIFDFYFEYRSVVSKRYVDIYSALLDCRQRGVQLHFLGGNHDYWVGEFLTEDLGVTLHSDEILAAAQGRKIVCAHGDLVLPRDFGYKILKSIIRNRVVIGLSKWIHPDIMDAIAGGVSSGSKMLQKHSQEERAQQVADYAHRDFYGRGNDVFVMGHVHCAYHDARDGRDFMIVGDWVTDFTYGLLAGGKLSLETFTD